jgi:hypothetical protein
MDARQASKLLALTDANRLVSDLATASDRSVQEWQFFCECGAADCHSLVALTLPEFEDLKETGKPVLASGHLLDQKERARVLREHSQALRAQAEHQLNRLRKNLGK